MKPIYLFSSSSHSDAIHINSLDISFLQPQIDFSLYDYLIITSKQTSKALQAYKKEQYIDKKALCISLQSAKSFEALGASVLEIGEGYGDTLIKKIQKYPKGTRWLYLRAQTIASEFSKDLLALGYKIDEEVLYKSTCSKEIAEFDLQKEAILIFTSPSSVKCFLKNKSIPRTSIVVVIGSSTASALPKGTKYILSKEKNIEACIEISKDL